MRGLGDWAYDRTHVVGNRERSSRRIAMHATQKSFRRASPRRARPYGRPVTALGGAPLHKRLPESDAMEPIDYMVGFVPVGSVHVLPSRAAGPEGVDSQVALVNVHVHLVEQSAMAARGVRNNISIGKRRGTPNSRRQAYRMSARTVSMPWIHTARGRVPIRVAAHRKAVRERGSCRGFERYYTSVAWASSATVTVDVWMRPWLSVAGTRCTR